MVAATRTQTKRPTLITNARVGKTLDTAARTRRYLLSMAVRVVCFIAGCLSPHPWNWVLFVGAAVIPTVAVLLANAIDQRNPEPSPSANEPSGVAALPPGTVISGSVED